VYLVVLAVIVEKPQGMDDVRHRGIVALDAENLAIELEGRRLPVKVAIDRCYQGSAVLSIDGHNLSYVLHWRQGRFPVCTASSRVAYVTIWASANSLTDLHSGRWNAFDFAVAT
jgi:hypothetical protein